MPGQPIGGGVTTRSYQGIYDKNGNMGMDSRGQWGYVGDQGAPATSAPAAPAASAPLPSLQGLFDASAGSGSSAPPAPGSGGGGGGAPSGAKVVDPASADQPPSMMGLQSAGDSGAPGANMLTGPSHFRQGIGSRLIPDQNSVLAGVRKLY